MDLLNRLALAWPIVRRLVEENGRLRSQLDELDLKVQQAAQETGALRSERMHALERFAELEAENARLRGEPREVRRPRPAPDLWIPAGHFYSPVVDPADKAVQRAIESEANPSASLASFGISEEEILRWFHVISGYYIDQPFPEHRTLGWRYYYGNPHFPLADALALLAFMCSRRPKYFVEIGAGFSSCAAIDINERYLNGQVQMTIIEPYPELALELIGPDSPYQGRFVKKKLQDTSLDHFYQLDAGDVLFIDSSHVAKTGSDVLDYMFRLLPALKPGVIIHLHDIFFPFEYPRAWIVGENRSWNEAYFLRAFLYGNASFRVLYFSDWIYKCRRDLVESNMPLCMTHRGGSIWLEVVGSSTISPASQAAASSSAGVCLAPAGER